MIYTVGIRLKYERAFAAGPVTKRGKTGDYNGGYVFRTADEAHKFLAAKGLTGTHMVMGVNADWDSDTEAEAGAPYRRLVRDAAVVKL
jgi:hypothetical protein